MTREDLVNEYLKEHRHDVLLNPYSGLLDFARFLDEHSSLPSELEEAARKYRDFREECGIKDPVMLDEIEEAHYAGAKWQAEQTRDEHFWNGIQYAKKELREFFNKHNEGDATIEDCFAYKEGYEHGRDEMKEIIEVAEDHAMLAGRIQMKEEMMEKALPGTFIMDENGGYIDLIPGNYEMKDMQPVKVIFVKDD